MRRYFSSQLIAIEELIMFCLSLSSNDVAQSQFNQPELNWHGKRGEETFFTIEILETQQIEIL